MTGRDARRPPGGRRWRVGTLGPLAAIALLISACGDTSALATADSAPGDQPAASLPSASTPGVAVAAGDGQPDVDRVMAHLEHLAVDIGPRAAGSAEERDAAAYIADALTDAGYTTTIEDFSFQATFDDSEVAIDRTPVRAVAMEGSPNAMAEGELALAGRGTEEDLAGVELDGRVAVFDRGAVRFGDMLAAAEARGAVAVVVVNNEEGLFRGQLGREASIPVVALELRHREEVRGASGAVTVLSAMGERMVDSQNVVATASDRCEGFLGAHYDSVPQGPGANDNASGAAVVMELARAYRRPGLCVVAFGAEEVGLYGSQAYVEEHPTDGARFMLNIDMAGRLDEPIVAGDAGLRDAVLAAVADAGLTSPLRAGAFPPFASSDHVSFEAVGVPAVTLNSGDDEAIHTAEDAIDRISREALAVFVTAAGAAIEALLPVVVPAGVR